MTSRIGGTQYDPSTLTLRRGDSKKSSIVIPYKQHRKKIVTSSQLRKYPIHHRERTEPCVSKHHRDQIVSMLSVHMMNKTLKITNSWMNDPTKAKKMRMIQKKRGNFSKL